MEQLEMLCDKLGVALSELVDAYAPYLLVSKVACAAGFAVAIAAGVAVSLAIMTAYRRHKRAQYGLKDGEEEPAGLKEALFQWKALTFGAAALFSVFIIIFVVDAITCAAEPRGYAIAKLLSSIGR